MFSSLTTWKWLLLISTVISLTLLIVFGVRTSIFAAKSYIVKGSIDGNLEEDGLFRPIYSYRVDDNTYRGQSTISTRPAQYKVGDQVNIRVSVSDPTNSQIDSVWAIWAIPIVLAISALLLTMFLLVVLWIEKNRKM